MNRAQSCVTPPVELYILKANITVVNYGSGMRIKKETNNLKVIEYDSKYRQSFIDFNTAWITDNFGHLEAEDYETFEKILTR